MQALKELALIRQLIVASLASSRNSFCNVSSSHIFSEIHIGTVIERQFQPSPRGCQKLSGKLRL